MSRRAFRGFTLIELLVVISIIALLIAMLLPALGNAKEVALKTMSASNQRQLAIGSSSYTNDHDGWFPPMQARKASSATETSWRVHLWEYVAQNPNAYDCPSETQDVYAKGAFDVQGRFHPNEIRIASGYGAVNVHWHAGGPTPPFGRTFLGQIGGYEDNLCNLSKVESPAEMILFGDGHGDKGDYPYDRFWIWKRTEPANDPFFDRIAEGQYGATRHLGGSNYSFADTSGRWVVPTRENLPCDGDRCFWSAERDPHEVKVTRPGGRR